MVDAIRCMMRYRRGNTTVTSDERREFLLRLRGWHNLLVWARNSTDEFHRLLHITRTADDTDSRCLTMLYDTKGKFTGRLCQNIHHGRYAWCLDHTPLHLRSDGVVPASRMNYDNWNAASIISLPDFITAVSKEIEIEVVGHFDGAWKNDDWTCSVDTMKHQLNRFLTSLFWNGQPSGLAALRFVDMTVEDSEYILQSRIPWSDLQRAQSTLVVEWLCVHNSESSDLLGEFVMMVLRTVPLFRWPTAYLSVCQWPCTWYSIWRRCSAHRT